MKLFILKDRERDLEAAIAKNIKGDYIYSYPPRQTYSSEHPELPALAIDSVHQFNVLNLYFHIPFCRQICSFCNLYAMKSENEEMHTNYVTTLLKEFDNLLPLINEKRIRTIYIGGGTPSLLSLSNFERLFVKITSLSIEKSAEIALEVAPDTVEEIKFTHLKELGLNRVNLGFQTTEDTELKEINRKHGNYQLHKAFDIIKKVNIPNTCIDLIYGFPNQSTQNWLTSLQTVIQFNPETICIYPLTLRPNTGFSAKGYTSVDGFSQYEKFVLANDLLIGSGYRRETNVRYIKDGGGYKQKENHWRLENILGFGAGARSYLWNCDTRNGYNLVARKNVLHEYIQHVEMGINPIADGFVLNWEERKRKAVILGLHSLNRAWYKEIFGNDVINDFGEELLFLRNRELINIFPDSINLTEDGIKYRDLIAEFFFSDQVISLLKALP
ncbi:coproporphyrinogen-III oxidase family protein [Larkinella terrae]|uniref:Radical SAM protein n=1 Tax=Larkinella terrae TaxID=2025311 RepID=A0A7K0ESG8_9BACT|nr:coproporphyrinogen-III oxidase family protein [Larkinella terrae]MRS64757.1 radical SAM protein [Larkinella terrae]